MGPIKVVAQPTPPARAGFQWWRTPFWILAFGEYWKQTADTALLQTESAYRGLSIENNRVENTPLQGRNIFAQAWSAPGVAVSAGVQRLRPFEGGAERGKAGHTLVGGKRFDWQNFDTLAVPANEWYEHVNESKSPIVLFVASDEPALRAFGLHRKYGRTAAGDVEKLI